MIRPQVVSRYLLIFVQSITVLPTHFAISVVPHLFYCRPTSAPPPYQSLLSRICFTVVSIRVISYLHHCDRPPLSSLTTLSALPIIPERQYALMLVVVSCQYFTSLLPSSQPISPSPSSHISSVDVPHLIHRRIHPCCPASLPVFSSATVFTDELVCHPHYPGATIRPQVGSRSMSIFTRSVAVIPTHFSIFVVPHLICCRPASPPPPYPSLVSRIYATIFVHRCLHL